MSFDDVFPCEFSIEVRKTGLTLVRVDGQPIGLVHRVRFEHCVEDTLPKAVLEVYELPNAPLPASVLKRRHADIPWLEIKPIALSEVLNVDDADTDPSELKENLE